MRAVIIRTDFHEGSWNMAFDRLLMELVGDGEWDFVLRTYGWKPACVSLGRLQNIHREVDVSRLLSRGYGVVRRPTGGRAVWHETELTYSIVAPLGNPAVSGPIREALRKTTAPMLKAIASLGVQVTANPMEKHSAGGPRMKANPCFTSHGVWEIGTPDGRKMVGSAQARSRGVFLEHGSILLENDQPKILEFLPDDVPRPMRMLLHDHLSSGIASLREFRPDLSIRELDDALEKAYSGELGVDLISVAIEELPADRLMELEKECRIEN